MKMFALKELNPRLSLKGNEHWAKDVKPRGPS
jgi:hypothetical protein